MLPFIHTESLIFGRLLQAFKNLESLTISRCKCLVRFLLLSFQKQKKLFLQLISDIFIRLYQVKTIGSMYSRISVIATIGIIIFGIFYQKYIIQQQHKERRAWLTLFSTQDYLPGVLALARSLKRAKSIYPLVVMCTKDDCSEETETLLLNEGCFVQHIEDLYPVSTTGLTVPRLTHAWKKLRAFALVDICDTCVFMDADIIVLRNMDEIFDLNQNINFAAVQTCTCNLKENPIFPKHWKPQNCPYAQEQNSNGPTHDNSHVNIIFNSGVFLFHPNLTVFQQMLEALNTWDLSQFVFADQDFLNKFYDKTWTRLPFMYNGVKAFSHSHPDLWDLSKLKTIHYVLAKPWQKTDVGNIGYEVINQLWWQAYEWRSETS